MAPLDVQKSGSIAGQGTWALASYCIVQIGKGDNMEEWYTIGAHSEEELKQMFYEDGYREGHEESKRKDVTDMSIEEMLEEEKNRGRQEGETLLASLVNKLLSSGRIGDVRRAVDDVGYREELYLQFGLSYPSLHA